MILFLINSFVVLLDIVKFLNNKLVYKRSFRSVYGLNNAELIKYYFLHNIKDYRESPRKKRFLN